jgi:hypothetical protein
MTTMKYAHQLIEALAATGQSTSIRFNGQILTSYQHLVLAAAESILNAPKNAIWKIDPDSHAVNYQTGDGESRPPDQAAFEAVPGSRVAFPQNSDSIGDALRDIAESSGPIVAAEELIAECAVWTVNAWTHNEHARIVALDRLDPTSRSSLQRPKQQR